MFLIFNQILIARSSSDILFFKLVFDEQSETMKWQQYRVIEARGFIYYIKGNVRIQITTDELIYFYLIDKETLEPILENVMFNYMNCTQMMFGSKVKYGVTYKTNQKSFGIYRRKYMHNFKVTVSQENLEGSRGLEFSSMEIFLVSKVGKVIMYSSDTYKEICEIKIDLLPTETREPNEIIAMQKCQNDEYLAIITGKNLVASEQKINQLFIYRRNRKYQVTAENDDDDQNLGIAPFEFVTKIVLKELSEFTDVSMDFHFKL